MKTTSNKYLLCVPLGGLNDTLCQLEKCWNYAQKYGRSLIIDARRSGLLDDFSEFFHITDQSIPSRPQLADDMIAERYAAGYQEEFMIDGVQSFDFAKNHSDTVLIHQTSGGGALGSRRFMHRIKLADKIIPTVRASLAQLPRQYIGIHIRNTDHKTDYWTYFNTIYNQTIDQPVLICTDDSEVVTAAKNFFTRSTVFTAIEIPKSNKTPLHRSGLYQTQDSKRLATTHALIDLIALARAKKIFFTDVAAGYPSGFSRLALSLNGRRYLVRNLLSEQTSTDKAMMRLAPYEFRFNELLRNVKKTVAARSMD